MVCMASSWVSKRENCCARQVGGRLGLEPARTPEKWTAGRASDEHRAMRVAIDLSTTIFRYRSSTLCW